MKKIEGKKSPILLKLKIKELLNHFEYIPILRPVWHLFVGAEINHDTFFTMTLNGFVDRMMLRHQKIKFAPMHMD